MDAIVGCVGPLATSARDLELFCRVMLDNEPWLVEAPLLDMPWKTDVAKGVGLPTKLSIAILFDDGVVAPHPPITSALKRYKQALIAAGHDVIEWRPLDHQKGWDIIASPFTFANIYLGPRKLNETFTGEIILTRWWRGIYSDHGTIWRACCAANQMDA